jgi:hypothetical protein
VTHKPWLPTSEDFLVLLLERDKPFGENKWALRKRCVKGGIINQKVNIQTNTFTYRILTARRTLVHNLFLELIPRGRLDGTLPLPMYVPFEPFPLNRAKPQV